MNRIKSCWPLLAFMLLCVSSFQVFSNEHSDKTASEEMLAEMWVMVPKAGKMRELEQALKEHLKFRQSKNDSRDWHIYSPVLGHKLDRIAVRANNFTWEDMDSYKDWSKNNNVSQHWEDKAGQLVEHYHHYLAIEDRENSHWGQDVSYKYVGVTNYLPKIGHGEAINKDISMLSDAAKKQGWPYHWSFSRAVGGQGELTLAVPYENWAAMAKPEESFAAMLAKHMGDENKARESMERWASHFQKIDYNIWSLRSDLME